MTEFKKRSFIIILLLICACAIFAFGTTISARAEGKSVGEVTLTMDEGADVRLVNGNGMRFSCTISTADYDALTEKYGEGNFSFGIFLMPKAYETKIGPINYDNTFGSPLYIWGDSAISAVVDGKYRILHMETLPVKNGDVYKMYGSVINMLDANVGLDYVACAYVKAGAEVKFADTTARSIVEVALRALNSGDYDAMETEKAVLNGYVEKFTDNYKAANGGEEPAFDYKVRYVADGETVDTTTVVEDVKMNSGVTTRITAPSGYALNRSSIISGYVYAKDIIVDVEVISATAISSESDLHNKYLKESNLKYSIEDDIDCTTATSITHNSWITADGIIDGKGHIITDPVIDDDITSYGLVGARFGNGLESPAAIRDLAVVNLTNSYRNYLSYETNCGRIENCYFSGSCKYHDIFEYVYGGGVTLKNVILDCYCSVDGYALGKAGESGAANVVYENVITLDKNKKGAHTGSEYGGTLMTYEEFFAAYAEGLPDEWEDSGFTVDNEGLKFHDTLLLRNEYVAISTVGNRTAKLTSEVSSVKRVTSGGKVTFKAELAAGDTFTYGKPLDFSGKTSSDTFVKFYVTPKTTGIADVKNVKVRLTDIYDENNYVEMVVFSNCNEENGSSYASYAGARHSEMKNYVGSYYKDWDHIGSVENVIYYNVQFHVEGGYWSFGQSFITDTGVLPFEFSMDYAEKALYGSDTNTAHDPYMTHILADLDADYCSVKWGGFTSGKAYLSIYSDMYVNSTFGFEIYEIFDEDLSEEYCYVGNSDDHAVLDEDPVLPVYLVNGTSFSLPTVTGTTYVNGEEVGTGIVANSWYRFDDGELHSYNGDPIVVSASEKVTLYYSIDGGVTKCYVIPVIPTSISFR